MSAAPDGLRLSVRLQPGAASERIIGLAADAHGALALKVAVTAPPEAGKANEALLRLLARTVRLPKRNLTLEQGASARRKLIHLAGDPRALEALVEKALAPWLKRG